MIRLYQREECPACTKVRRFLANHHMPFEAVNVPRLASQRDQVLALKGLDNADVPVLEDGATVLQDSEKIISYLEQKLENPGYGDPTYGLTRVLSGMTFEQGIEKTKTALATEGFGVLTEIDVKSTLKKKIDVDFKNYVILGACNPKLAYKGLTAEPGLGLLLPCNVVVTENPDGGIVVSSVDPRKMFQVVENTQLEEVAAEVRQKLARVLDSIA